MNPALVSTPRPARLILPNQSPRKFDDLIEVARELAAAHPLPMSAVADVAAVTARIWFSRDEPNN